MKTAEIAPGRFSWRKYPEQINIEQVRRRLTDAALPRKGGHVVGSQKTGWQLTANGLRFCEEVAPTLNADLGRQPMSKAERNWANREKARMISSEAIHALNDGGPESVTRRQAESFFKLDDYVRGEAREKKISRIVNAFGRDPELGPAIELLLTMVREDQ